MQTPKLQVIRRSSFTATPWKNGGGITHEAIRVPANGDPFRWRVSVAHIDASGPFSDFSTYYHKMVLLRGGGVELRFADGKPGLARPWPTAGRVRPALAGRATHASHCATQSLLRASPGWPPSRRRSLAIQAPIA